jgi:hypothetical protein
LACRWRRTDAGDIERYVAEQSRLRPSEPIASTSLDVLILKALSWGPRHDYAIVASTIVGTSD